MKAIFIGYSMTKFCKFKYIIINLLGSVKEIYYNGYELKARSSNSNPGGTACYKPYWYY